jgi:hypothetical protein
MMKPYRYWTAAEVLRAIQRWARAHRRPPIGRDFEQDDGLPSLTTIYKHFARLADAREAAHLPRGYEGYGGYRGWVSTGQRQVSRSGARSSLRANSRDFMARKQG